MVTSEQYDEALKELASLQRKTQEALERIELMPDKSERTWEQIQRDGRHFDYAFNEGCLWGFERCLEVLGLSTPPDDNQEE